MLCLGLHMRHSGAVLSAGHPCFRGGSILQYCNTRLWTFVSLFQSRFQNWYTPNVDTQWLSCSVSAAITQGKHIHPLYNIKNKKHKTIQFWFWEKHPRVENSPQCLDQKRLEPAGAQRWTEAAQWEASSTSLDKHSQPRNSDCFSSCNSTYWNLCTCSDESEYVFMCECFRGCERLCSVELQIWRWSTIDHVRMNTNPKAALPMQLYLFISFHPPQTWALCSLAATHWHTCDNTFQTSVHHPCCQNYTKLIFYWKRFIEGSLLSIKLHHKNIHMCTHTATNLQVTPKHPEPSTTLHKGIQSTKWRNNTRQQYSSVLFTMGFHSGKCLEFQNTTSFLKYMSILNRALCL